MQTNKPTPNIKILISHLDRRCPPLHSDILCPVQVGCALKTDLYPDMYHDNDGENISAHNPKYCELSAVYWGWKNQDKLGNPDYVGLMHDRRHFLFNANLPIPNKQVTWMPHSPVYMFPPVCPEYLTYLTDDVIRSYFPAYDVMVLKPYDFRARVGNQATLLDQFLRSEAMSGDIFDVWQTTIKKLFPDYTNELNAYINGHTTYLCSMSVMRKDLYEQYCHFTFTVLKAVDEQINSSQFSAPKKRFLGYLGEFMLSLFVMKLKRTRPDVRFVELNGVFFMPADCPEYHQLTRYKLCKQFLWGKLRQKYQKKYDELSDKLAILKFFEGETHEKTA